MEAVEAALHAGISGWLSVKSKWDQAWIFTMGLFTSLSSQPKNPKEALDHLSSISPISKLSEHWVEWLHSFVSKNILQTQKDRPFLSIKSNFSDRPIFATVLTFGEPFEGQNISECTTREQFYFLHAAVQIRVSCDVLSNALALGWPDRVRHPKSLLGCLLLTRAGQSSTDYKFAVWARECQVFERDPSALKEEGWNNRCYSADDPLLHPWADKQSGKSLSYVAFCFPYISPGDPIFKESPKLSLEALIVDDFRDYAAKNSTWL